VRDLHALTRGCGRLCCACTRDYDALDRTAVKDNLERAFTVAASVGIPRLLEVEDVADYEVRCTSGPAHTPAQLTLHSRTGAETRPVQHHDLRLPVLPRVLAHAAQRRSL
jgi:hypothetical protein